MTETIFCIRRVGIFLAAALLLSAIPLSAQSDADDGASRRLLQHERDNRSARNECVEILKGFRATILASQEKIPGFGGIKMLRYQVKEGQEPFSVDGNISGRLTVEVEIQGFTAKTTITYYEYSDIPGIVLNGPQTTFAGFNGDGEMTGTVVVTGDISGTIGLDEVIIKDKKAAGGVYLVTPEDGELVRLPYTVIWPQQ